MTNAMKTAWLLLLGLLSCTSAIEGFEQATSGKASAASVAKLQPDQNPAKSGDIPVLQAEVATTKDAESEAESLSSEADFDNQVAEAVKYLTVSPNNKASFDMAAAKAAGASDFTLAVGQVADQLQFGSPKQSQRTTSLPIWGNWCGPGHGGGPTKDRLDEQCKKHDECYDRRGYFSKACDLQLLIDLSKNFFRFGFKAKLVAVAIAAYFKIQILIPFPG